VRDGVALPSKSVPVPSSASPGLPVLHVTVRSAYVRRLMMTMMNGGLRHVKRETWCLPVVRNVAWGFGLRGDIRLAPLGKCVSTRIDAADRSQLE